MSSIANKYTQEQSTSTINLDGAFTLSNVQLQEKIHHLQSKIQLHESELEQFRIKNMSVAVSTKTATNGQLIGTFLSMINLPKEETAHLGEQFSELRVKIADEETVIKKCHHALDGLQKELQKLTDQIESNSLFNIMIEYNSINFNSAEKTKERDLLTSEINTLTFSLNTKKNNRASIKQKIAQLQTKRTNVNTEIDQLTKQQMQLEQKMTLLRLHHALDNKALVSCETRIKSTQDEIESAQIRITEFATQRAMIYDIFVKNLKGTKIDDELADLKQQLNLLISHAKKRGIINL